MQAAAEAAEGFSRSRALGKAAIENCWIQHTDAIE